MTLDWALPALRWSLYTDFSIVFGLPMAAAMTGSRDALEDGWGVLALASLFGIAFSMLGFLVVVANMAGVSPAEVDRALVLSLLTGTALGWALIVRCMALALYAAIALLRSPSRLAPPIAASGTAVATLAWSGHAATSQGAAGWLRLGGDIAHLLGALSWGGALALFVALLWRPLTDASALRGQVASALANFSFAGSVIVALLVLTGTANLLFLMPADELPQLIHSLYGQLLLAKLVGFFVMLGLASLNRFKLVPALKQAQHTAAGHSAIRTLRLSVSLELLTALGVFALVAWAGTLDPLATGN